MFCHLVWLSLHDNGRFGHQRLHIVDLEDIASRLNTRVEEDPDLKCGVCLEADVNPYIIRYHPRLSSFQRICGVSLELAHVLLHVPYPRPRLSDSIPIHGSTSASLFSFHRRLQHREAAYAVTCFLIPENDLAQNERDINEVTRRLIESYGVSKEDEPLACWCAKSRLAGHTFYGNLSRLPLDDPFSGLIGVD